MDVVVWAENRYQAHEAVLADLSIYGRTLGDDKDWWAVRAPKWDRAFRKTMRPRCAYNVVLLMELGVLRCYAAFKPGSRRDVSKKIKERSSV